MTLGDLLNVLGTAVAVLVPIAGGITFWLNRPHARLERALTVYREMPEGAEREAWESIVHEESRALRARRDPTARRQLFEGWGMAGICVLGFFTLILKLIADGPTPQLLLGIGHTAGLLFAVLSLGSAYRRRALIRRAG